MKREGVGLDGGEDFRETEEGEEDFHCRRKREGRAVEQEKRTFSL